ncbi:MAG: hypothetical protein FWG99_11560 [Treponema sp.]|nr:hypothetical protein [Treponema sp.]
MEISINGKAVDIVLDAEKSIGDIMSGLEKWLDNCGHRLSGLAIDGKPVNTAELDAVFSSDIDAVKSLDIFTSSLPELVVQSLVQIINDIDEYEKSGFEEKRGFYDNWKETPQGMFTAEQLPDLFRQAGRTFSGAEISPYVLRAITEEWLREYANPAGEFAAIEPLISEICVRLEELPVDIQTGRDGRALQTIQIFSSVTEKVFRLIKIFKIQGFPADDVMIGDTLATDCIAEFNRTVEELMAAYEQRDTVLAGDIAEYELAPRLRSLFAAFHKIFTEQAAVNAT